MKVEFESFEDFAQCGTLIGMSVVTMQSSINSAKNNFDNNMSFHNSLQSAFDSYCQISASCDSHNITVDDYKPFDWWCAQLVKDEIFIGVVKAYIPKLKNTYKELHECLAKTCVSQK